MTSRDRRDPRAGFCDRAKLPRGPRGHALCRECGDETPTKRTTFCSPACVDAWRVRTDPGFVRELLFRRDHEVCAACGLDCAAFHRQAEQRGTGAGGYAGWPTMNYSSWLRWHRAMKIDHSGSPWDADHILPVAEGGGLCGIDGYQVLCRWCHREKTAEQAQAASRRRKAARGARTP